MSPLSVVIVTHNSRACIVSALESVTDEAPEWEIIVVDNNSTDGTVEVVEDLYPQVTLVRASSNLGFGRANNIGVRSARSDHVLLMNPDARLLSVDVDALVSPFGDPEFGLMTPRLRLPNGVDVPNARPVRSAAAEWFSNTVHTLVARELPRFRPEKSRKGRMWAPASVLIVRKSEFEAIGGFPEEVFLYYEDQLLSRRYVAAGYSLQPTDAAVFSHSPGLGSVSSGGHRSLQRVSALLGWLTMVEEFEGELSARKWSSRSLRSLRLMRTGVRGILKWVGREGRLSAKARQIESDWVLLQSVIEDGGLCVEGERFYEHAAVYLREVS